MRLTPMRLIAPLLSLLVVAGCSALPGGDEKRPNCGGDTEYLQAVERPPLRLPPEITPTERAQPMAIPPVDPAPQKLDPVPACLDQPPKFFTRKAGGAMDTPEDAVKLWAWAWASRKPDTVLQMYSPNFLAPGTLTREAYLEQVREQVASGPAAEPKVENLTAAASGTDRRVVTFVQRFGNEEVRKEQTLAREGGIWRIVAEQTL
jgi:hypothetical protein